MNDKSNHEVKGEIPPTYCCDGEEAIEDFKAGYRKAEEIRYGNI